MPGRTQNHPEMPRNLKVLRLKMPPCAKTAVFCRVIFFTLFLLPFFRHFWWISSPFGLPRSKRRWSVLGNFFVIFRFFLRFWLLLQFWSIFLAQGDQKCRKKRWKNKPNHQPRHQFLPPATPPASNERGLTSWPDLPMTSSSTLPSVFRKALWTTAPLSARVRKSSTSLSLKSTKQPWNGVTTNVEKLATRLGRLHRFQRASEPFSKLQPESNCSKYFHNWAFIFCLH